jgi:crossover junction endodeoxyribonuclease RuvC
MLVVGIDPGTAITGYGFVREERDGRLVAVDYGVVNTPAKMEMPLRLAMLHTELSKVLALHNPAGAAVEKLFFQKNVKTAITVAQGRGVSILTLAQAGLEIGEYTPLEIKQSVTGYGSADKKQVQEMVRMILGLNEIPKPDDAADALAVAICHLHHLKTNHLYGSSQ